MLSTIFIKSKLADAQPDLDIEQPTINILLYTDDPENITAGEGLLSLGIMIAHLKAHAPAFAHLCVELVSRNSDKHTPADCKLTVELISKYHEIWFFGLHQANRENFTLGALRGGPESELDENEVLALADWMSIAEDKGLHGGGVLMTGDHGHPRPVDAKPGHNPLCPDDARMEPFLGLGRAIGRCVPRAGLLRRWKGKPTNRKEDSFNSQVLTPGINVEDKRLQQDRVPQQLILRHFNSMGDPAPEGNPHPLFLYKEKSWIRVFPDHVHEGAVTIPGAFDEKVWPKVTATQPKPQVVAYGVDERNRSLQALLVAYNGDSANVGRIVADSTWHHYFNMNLNGFRPPAPEGSAADQIGQYYANLAFWLSPRGMRSEMAQVMFQWMATHPSMLEEVRHDTPGVNDLLGIGRIAYSILSEVASPCEIHELLYTGVPDDYREQFETLYFPDSGILSPLPSKEWMLGRVINWYHQEMITVESSANSLQSFDVLNTIETGFKKALDEHATQLMRVALDARNPLTFRASQIRSINMSYCEDSTWTILMTKDKSSPEPRPDTLFFDLKIAGGVISGDVFLLPDNIFLSKVSGMCQAIETPGITLMDMLFTWDAVEVYMAGIAFADDSLVKFKGRFHATTLTDNLSAQASREQLLNLLDPGDTGTGTGQQT
jgi:hypothetical protein